MKHFYVIGDNGSIVSREQVTKEEWRTLWAWAVEVGLTISHWISTQNNCRCIRAHKGD